MRQFKYFRHILNKTSSYKNSKFMTSFLNHDMVKKFFLTICQNLFIIGIGQTLLFLQKLPINIKSNIFKGFIFRVIKKKNNKVEF